MAEIQFAAGAGAVQVAHETAPRYTSWKEAQQGIAALPYQAHLTKIASAHVMGGCMMAGDPRAGVTGPDGRYHGLANLSVHDGSLFPTSIGANPQLSIYGITARLASQLAQALTGRAAPVPRAGAPVAAAA
jgi:choline dehydrogenase-like flavoprotein